MIVSVSKALDYFHSAVQKIFIHDIGIMNLTKME